MKLQYPTKVEGSSTLLLNACAPQAQHVKMIFPARENMPKVAMPEVEVHWYDGGMMPERPKGFPEGKQLMQSGGGLTIFHGTKDTLICGCYGQNPWLLSGRKPNAPKVCRRVPNAMNGGHEMDWVRACKENKSNRIMTKSDFSEAGPMNEMVAMGVLAIRLQALNKTLEWDELTCALRISVITKRSVPLSKTDSRFMMVIRHLTRHGLIRLMRNSLLLN